jgi:hypothetical protein
MSIEALLGRLRVTEDRYEEGMERLLLTEEQWEEHSDVSTPGRIALGTTMAVAVLVGATTTTMMIAVSVRVPAGMDMAVVMGGASTVGFERLS